MTAQRGVLELADDPYASAAKFLCDFVVGDGLRDHVSLQLIEGVRNPAPAWPRAPEEWEDCHRRETDCENRAKLVVRL